MNIEKLTYHEKLTLAYDYNNNASLDDLKRLISLYDETTRDIVASHPKAKEILHSLLDDYIDTDFENLTQSNIYELKQLNIKDAYIEALDKLDYYLLLKMVEKIKENPLSLLEIEESTSGGYKVDCKINALMIMKETNILDDIPLDIIVKGTKHSDDRFFVTDILIDKFKEYKISDQYNWDKIEPNEIYDILERHSKCVVEYDEYSDEMISIQHYDFGPKKEEFQKENKVQLEE